MKLTAIEYETRRVCRSLDGCQPEVVKAAIKAMLTYNPDEAPYMAECAAETLSKQPEWMALRITDRMAWADQLNNEIDRRLTERAEELYDDEIQEQAA